MTRASARDFWVEIALCAGGLATCLGALWAVDYPQNLPGAGLALIATWIVRADWRARIIPDLANLAAALLGLVEAALSDDIRSMEISALIRGAALFLMFFAFRKAFLLWRGREGMGFGDVKLAGVLGIWLDWSYIPVAIEIACLSAIAYVLAPRLLFGRPLDPTAKIPFGAFFAPSIWLVWLFTRVLG